MYISRNEGMVMVYAVAYDKGVFGFRKFGVLQLIFVVQFYLLMILIEWHGDLPF